MKEYLKKAVDLIEIPGGVKESVMAGIDMAISERKDIKMKRSVKKIATVGIAAAVTVCALGVTAAAVTVFSGNIGRENAFASAASYAVSHADGGEKEELVGLIVGGKANVESVSESEISLGLSGLRPVYNVDFTVGGYAYSMEVDGKTGVVLEYSRVLSSEEPPAKELPENFEVTMTDAFDITSDWFGLFNTKACEDWRYNSSCEDTEDGYKVVAEHGGYAYSCKVDRKTGSVSEASVTEIKGAKNRHLHEADESYFGLYNAKKLIYKDIGSVPEPDSGIAVHVTFVADTPEKPNGYGMDVYLGSADLVNSTVSNAYVIDAHTGEIISGSVYDSDTDKASVSTEAPEGMISEAEAKAIALGDANATENRINGFEITLEGETYAISFEAGNENGVYDYSCKIDAKTGEILESKTTEK